MSECGRKMMKIKELFLAFVLSLSAMFILSACGANEEMQIENYDWELSVIQSNETGEIVYCSEEIKEVHSDAKILSLSCSIEEEYIILSTNNNRWKIKYTEIEKTAESVIYDVEYGETDHVYVGNAVLGVTTYSDESTERTLIINLGEYALHFVAKV